jgi:hypothetical protein
MPQHWQEIDVACHTCHFRRDIDASKLPAMSILPFLVTVLAVLAMAFVVFSLVHLVASDGLRLPRPTPPRSHEPDLFEPHRFA